MRLQFHPNDQGNNMAAVAMSYTQFDGSQRAERENNDTTSSLSWQKQRKAAIHNTATTAEEDKSNNQGVVFEPSTSSDQAVSSVYTKTGVMTSQVSTRAAAADEKYNNVTVDKILNGTKYLQQNSANSSAAIKELQTMLKDAQLTTASPDGVFGSATNTTVLSFQTRIGLTPDGKVGMATWNALKSYASAIKSPVTTQGSTLKYTTSTTSNNNVREMQTKLKTLGYLSGNVDGVFGKSTLEAVFKFQTAYALGVDGQAGTSTLSKINAANNMALSTIAATKELATEGKPVFGVKPVNATLTDVSIVARCLYGETNSDEGMRAVAQVIANRVKQSAYPGTAAAVVKAANQFASVSASSSVNSIGARPDITSPRWKTAVALAKSLVNNPSGTTFKSDLKNNNVVEFRSESSGLIPTGYTKAKSVVYGGNRFFWK